MYNLSNNIEKKLKKLSNKEKAKVLASFFKTGNGDYGEGDIFLGIAVPDTRRVVKEEIKNIKEKNFNNLRKDITILLSSKYHEIRMAGVIILVEIFSKEKDEKIKKDIFVFYLKNINKINNWDLVDTSSPHIVGKYLLDKKLERKVLYQLAQSKNIWERRVSVVATFSFIKRKEYEDTFSLCKIDWILLKNCDAILSFSPLFSDF